MTTENELVSWGEREADETTPDDAMSVVDFLRREARRADPTVGTFQMGLKHAADLLANRKPITEDHLFDSDDYRHPMWMRVQDAKAQTMWRWRLAGLNALADALVPIDGKHLDIVEQFCRELHGGPLTSVSSISAPLALGRILQLRYRFTGQLTRHRDVLDNGAARTLYTRDVNVITGITNKVIEAILKADEGE